MFGPPCRWRRQFGAAARRILRRRVLASWRLSVFALNLNKIYDRKLGLVINFGERILKAGIHRVVNVLPEDIEFNAKTQRRYSDGGGRQPIRDQDGLRRRLARAKAA